MLNWFWVRLKAMHWAAKLFSVVFLLHAAVYLAQAYQLTYLKIPAFNELRRAEGKLILVKKGRDWLTGVEHTDGSEELFTCQRPGTGLGKFCFTSDVVNKFKLDTKPEVTIWWYPISTPLEDKIYPYIFQIQLKGENEPFGFARRNWKRVEYSYQANIDAISLSRSQGVRGKIGMAILYAFGVLFLFLWQSFKYSTREE
jgi:hypothetical protein